MRERVTKTCIFISSCIYTSQGWRYASLQVAAELKLLGFKAVDGPSSQLFKTEELQFCSDDIKETTTILKTTRRYQRKRDNIKDNTTNDIKDNQLTISKTTNWRYQRQHNKRYYRQFDKGHQIQYNYDITDNMNNDIRQPKTMQLTYDTTDTQQNYRYHRYTTQLSI